MNNDTVANEPAPVPAARPSRPAPGQVIAGKYELQHLLGSGGMGAVYAARHRITGKRCAVKLLLSPDLAGEQQVRRFFREARAGSAVESDHIVEIYDSGADPETGYPYIVMELLSGEDLASVAKRLGALEPKTAAKLILQTATGLMKAHAAGVVHRDIKPANLYLIQRDAGDLLVKILDFGIAKVKLETFHEASTTLTKSGSLLGTPLYMSPEQCKGAHAIDARSDVWSLGVVLWELLSGSSPYPEATSLGSLMASIISADLPLLQDRAPWVAPELAEITHRALSRDLAQRFRHAGELRDALAQFLAPESAFLYPPELVPVSTERRSVPAPRLVLPNASLLSGTARPVVASLPHSQERPRSSWRRLNVVLPLVGALGALGALVPTLLKPRVPTAETRAIEQRSDPPLRLTPSTAPPPPAPPPEIIKKFTLSLAPADVEVNVDGVPGVAENGKLALEGEIGTTRRVRIAWRGKSEEHLVAITESGLVPDRLELSPRRNLAPSAKPVAKPEASNNPSAPLKPAKPASDLSESTEEFEN